MQLPGPQHFIEILIKKWLRTGNSNKGPKKGVFVGALGSKDVILGVEFNNVHLCLLDFVNNKNNKNQFLKEKNTELQ